MTGLAVGLLLCGAVALLWFRGPAKTLPDGLRTSRTPAAVEGTVPTPGGTGIRDPALMLDLAAAMLAAGRPLNTVLRILSDAAEPPLGAVLRRVVTALELGALWEQAWDLADKHVTPSGRGLAPATALRDALAFAASSGAPSAQVLHAQAAQLRRRRAREAERRAAALGIHLVLPLGLCALPAFLCFTVVPLLLALLPEF